MSLGHWVIWNSVLLPWKSIHHGTTGIASWNGDTWFESCTGDRWFTNTTRRNDPVRLMNTVQPGVSTTTFWFMNWNRWLFSFNSQEDFLTKSSDSWWAILPQFAVVTCLALLLSQKLPWFHRNMETPKWSQEHHCTQTFRNLPGSQGQPFFEKWLEINWMMIPNL